MDSKWIRVNSLNLDNEFTSQEINPHPLQSQLWGNIRKKNDLINFDNYINYKDKKIIAYARIEERRIFKFIKLAWIPKGPTINKAHDSKEIIDNLIKNLKERGFILLITDRYKQTPKESSIQTIKLNLSLDENKILSNMHPNIRYAIRRSKKENITFHESCDTEEIKKFYKMCKDLSNKKKFKLPGSESIMIDLIKNSNKKSYIQKELKSPIRRYKLKTRAAKLNGSMDFLVYVIYFILQNSLAEAQRASGFGIDKTDGYESQNGNKSLEDSLSRKMIRSFKSAVESVFGSN